MYYNITVQDFKIEWSKTFILKTDKSKTDFDVSFVPQSRSLSLSAKMYGQIIFKTWQIIALHIGVMMHFKSCCPHQQSGLYLKPQDLAKA